MERKINPVILKENSRTNYRIFVDETPSANPSFNDIFVYQTIYQTFQRRYDTNGALRNRCLSVSSSILLSWIQQDARQSQQSLLLRTSSQQFCNRANNLL